MRLATLDAELKRLAPSATADPDALSATRARVMAVVHGVADEREYFPAADIDRVIPITGVAARRRLALRVGAAAAIAAAGVVGATLWPDPTASWIPAAHASWRAVPAPVTPGDAQAQAKACLSLTRHADPDGTGYGPLRLDDLVPVVAERRGDWTYTLLTAGPRGDRTATSLTCLLPTDPTSREAGNVGGGAGSIVRVPASDQIQWVGGGWGGEWFDVWGYAGDDVGRVTATLANDVVVDATVSDGYFAGWWPTAPPVADGSHALPFTLTWYLKDGTPGGTYEWTASGVPDSGVAAGPWSSS